MAWTATSLPVAAAVLIVLCTSGIPNPPSSAGNTSGSVSSPSRGRTSREALIRLRIGAGNVLLDPNPDPLIAAVPSLGLLLALADASRAPAPIELPPAACNAATATFTRSSPALNDFKGTRRGNTPPRALPDSKEHSPPPCPVTVRPA